MPDTAERRPRQEGGAPDDAANVDTIVTAADDDIRQRAEQLKRRREASWRLPPLQDGYRDPLDRLRSAS
jgi:hypothetical protein